MSEKEAVQKEQAADHTKELEAMGKVASALNPLSEVARERVLAWANNFYRGAARVISASAHLQASSALVHGVGHVSGPLPDDLATFFSQANPGTESEKALVAAYWFLKHDGIDEVDSFRLNSQLAHLGHRVSNVTRALGALMATRPALIIQTRKEGKSKQARKKYKLTHEGIQRVQRMLAGETGAAA